MSLLLNNAGVLKYSTFINAPTLEAARAEMETNDFGTLSVCRAFAPFLAANGGGAIVNMLSVTSFYNNPHVVAVHAGFIDTDMAALTNAPKDSPTEVARLTFDAVESGQPESSPTTAPAPSRPASSATTS